MSSAAKSFTVNVGGFTQFLVLGPFPRAALVDQVLVYSSDTTNLTPPRVKIRVGFFSTPPQSVDEFTSAHALTGPFDIVATGNTFYLPVATRRQPGDQLYVGVEFVGSVTSGSLTGGAIATVFPPLKNKLEE